MKTDVGNQLVIEGTGGPGSDSFKKGIWALYSVASTMKLQLELEGQALPIGRLESLWWVDPVRPSRRLRNPVWRWKAMLPMPDCVDGQLVKLTRDTLVNWRGLDAAADVRIEPAGQRRSAA